MRKDGIETRNKILTVCVRLFLEQGYKNTTITQITEEAGISRGSFQNFFPTKDAVLLELVKTMFGGQFGAAKSIVGDNLNIKRFDCNLEWMLAVCYYRGTLKDYALNRRGDEIVAEVEASDVVVAPIADNKMFYVMAQFTDGEINADVALHSLSASKLGLQFIFKTDKALQNLIPIVKILFV